MRTLSLRFHIVILSIVAVALLWGIATAATWIKARHEAAELFDAHLVQVASLLFAQSGTDHDEAIAEDHAPDLHRYGRRVAFQIWRNGRLGLHSSNAPSQQFSETTDGFSVAQFGGEAWRVFSVRDPDNEVLIQVGETTTARDEVVHSLAGGLLAPLLVAMPALALLIWFAVGRGLRPLARLARDVEQRSPNNLSRLSGYPFPNEVVPLVDRLNALFDRVATSVEQERRFTADAAHELRTPLAALRAQAQVALGAFDNAGREEALMKVMVGCDRLAHLVDQLLQLARVDEVSERDSDDVNLTEVARNALAQHASLALAKNVDIGLRANDEVRISGNPAWLAVLARNLTDNAVRYCKMSGRVSVEVSKEDGKAILAVEDDGPGVPDAQLASLGERFWRSPETPHRRDTEGGSGLGLSIVRRIVELHGGTLHFSNLQPGLRVEVGLPGIRKAKQ
ncbi:MAG: ATP-binding protein [Betaproteobacteria bacterium]